MKQVKLSGKNDPGGEGDNESKDKRDPGFFGSRWFGRTLISVRSRMFSMAILFLSINHKFRCAVPVS
jgi:hypothetical protein